MARELPAGTVTFLFTDVEGSTKLLQELGAERYADALARHRAIMRDTFHAHDGVEVDTQGDAFFIAFPTAPGAVRAADDARRELADGPIRVRMGIHTGTPHLTEEGYVGADVHRAARIAACGHGGQILVSTATAALVGADELRDLGEHRLKDLSAPERIYQLGPHEFPPLKSLHQTNLPIPATPFVGREREVDEVLDLISQSGPRLLTLTGPGGTGKTRLGLQAAAEAADHYPDGIFWVPLAPLSDPRLVLETAGQSLGAQDGLAEHIADRRLLLLLDNFEHVVDAAPGLADLLTTCPNLHLLVTSRELLRVPGEQAYPVPPLKPEDGTELFLARARTALPNFVPTATVPALCARLENLPLAIELAAARVRVLSPEQLVERLSQRLDLLKAGRGVDPRQQTLRATIEWSHELLNDEEQRLFARLSVFAGGCTLETAEQVCDADVDTLQALVDKSLVRVREGDRFWMLETIREYASERLDASGEAGDLRRRHAEYFLALAEETEPHLLGSPGPWLDMLDAEHDNFRVALDRLEESGETELALRLAGALTRFWYMRNHFPEGRRRFERLLSVDRRPSPARGKALNGATVMAINTQDPETADVHAKEAFELNRAFGNSLGATYAVFLRGVVATEQKDFEHARAFFEQSAEGFRGLGDEHHTLLAMDGLAWAYGELGDRERRRELHEEILRRAREQSNERAVAMTLGQLAQYAGDEGRAAEAVSMLQESLRIRHSLADRSSIVDDLSRLARLLAAEQVGTTAACLLAVAQRLREEIGGGFGWVADLQEETLVALRAQLDEGALAEAMDRGRALSADQAVALVLEL